MISIDRKVCRDILKVTTDYNTSVIFSPDLGGYAIWHMRHPEKADLVSSVRPEEVPYALDRLSKRGMIVKIQGSFGGGLVFRIKSELLHAKRFWFDSFSKKFIGGFVSGVITGVVADLLVHWLIKLF